MAQWSTRRKPAREQWGRRWEEQGFARKGRQRRAQHSEWLRIAEGEREQGSRRRRKGLNRRIASAKLRRKTMVSSWNWNRSQREAVTVLVLFEVFLKREVVSKHKIL